MLAPPEGMSDKENLLESTAFGVLLTFKNFPPCPLKLLGVSERPVKLPEPPPPEAVPHESVPLPSVFKNCPLEPSAASKVNVGVPVLI